MLEQRKWTVADPKVTEVAVRRVARRAGPKGFVQGCLDPPNRKSSCDHVTAVSK